MDKNKSAIDQIASHDFKEIISIIPCGIMRISNDGNYIITYMNEAVLKMLGYTNDEIENDLGNSLKKMMTSEDFSTYTDAIKNKAINSTIQIEYRLIKKDGSMVWVMDRGKVVAGRDGTSEIFSVVTDISVQKNQILSLLEKAEKDSLTSLYNRMSSEKLIEDYIRSAKNGQMGALVIIDIDDFKDINDNFGHFFADTLLIDIAEILVKAKNDHDIVGRLGGDEFFIFFKDIPSREHAIKNITSVFSTINEVSKIRMLKHEMSCSGGIAFFPEDGTSFAQLYNNADLALYNAKELGKNRFSCFQNISKSGDLLGYRHKRHLDEDQNFAAIENNESRLLNYAFVILNETSNIERAIGVVLSTLVREYNLSRAYIFENSEDETYIFNSFEWCNEGIAPEIDNLQYLPRDVLEPYYHNLRSANGLFYCQDIKKMAPELREILEPQNIKSMLHFELTHDGKSFGFIGFDDCLTERFWDGYQVSIITQISKVISVFLSRYRLQQKYDHLINQKK